MRVRRAVPPYDTSRTSALRQVATWTQAAIVAFGGSDVLTVSAWYDQSGQSNHATQITPNSQPQIYNGTAVITVDGKPAIDFDGVNDRLRVHKLLRVVPYSLFLLN